MKRNVTLVAALILVCLAWTTGTLAQPGMMGRGGGGWGPDAPYARMYNPQTVETIAGEVVSVGKIMHPMKGMSYGVHLMVKTEKETLSVHLGPGWFLDNQEMKIAPHDMIEVKGSRITFEGKPALIAAEVKKGNEVLTLRSADGFPVWSGWRRR